MIATEEAVFVLEQHDTVWPGIQPSRLSAIVADHASSDDTRHASALVTADLDELDLHVSSPQSVGEIGGVVGDATPAGRH